MIGPMQKRKWTDERGNFVFEVPCEKNMTIESSLIDATSFKYFAPFEIEGRVTTFPYNVSRRSILRIDTRNNAKNPIYLKYHVTIRSQILKFIENVVIPFLRDTKRLSSAFRGNDMRIVLVMSIVPLFLSTYSFLISKRYKHDDDDDYLVAVTDDDDDDDEVHHDDDAPVDFFDIDNNNDVYDDELTFDDTLPPDIPSDTNESIAESLLDLSRGRVKFVVLECSLPASSRSS